ncbi:hypothetical protein STRTUCAR8_00570 [Streptomyces turgidiscabies Car8]|uniref:Uncharacterized protein n=1 Tax=Streptomyces turgidiscabies (strain Car8) TaxID=698760 RepID=L7EW62_STRT8|nr:hypothetical protein STRTUCAR8_00570 [Streptomyces turgidiscabies Car8]
MTVLRRRVVAIVRVIGPMRTAAPIRPSRTFRHRLRRRLCPHTGCRGREAVSF